MMNKLAYTINEVAAVLSISRSGVYRLINDGQLQPVKVGRKTLLPTETVQAWLNDLKARSASRNQ
jgi:excisionase family DNA binding protein